jgi:hypothetical protein
VAQLQQAIESKDGQISSLQAAVGNLQEQLQHSRVCSLLVFEPLRLLPFTDSTTSPFI